MTTYDNAPPLPEWSPEPHANRWAEPPPAEWLVPDNIELGSE